jgi:arginine/ornithine N-succinyltransferase beta subunit
MNRNEQEYYKDIAKIAKQLEIANKIKMLELSNELKGLSLKGIKDKI